jgi:hypothetical protein
MLVSMLLALSWDNSRKLENLIILGQKKKLLKKKTNYHNTLETLPKLLTNTVIKSFKLSSERLVSYLVLLDMLSIMKMWRHVKGYPANGQTTYTNANSSNKNKLLVNYRLNQFYVIFGKKKRNIFPTLIQAEYNNRLWFYMWRDEWFQGLQFLLSLVNPNKQSIPFDPVHLAKGQTNGYDRVGNAAKIGKSKKITKQGTIGVPIFFSRFIYADILPESFPFKLSISDDSRRKMGKKKKIVNNNKCRR